MEFQAPVMLQLQGGLIAPAQNRNPTPFPTPLARWRALADLLWDSARATPMNDKQMYLQILKLWAHAESRATALQNARTLEKQAALEFMNRLENGDER